MRDFNALLALMQIKMLDMSLSVNLFDKLLSISPKSRLSQLVDDRMVLLTNDVSILWSCISVVIAIANNTRDGLGR